MIVLQQEGLPPDTAREAFSMRMLFVSSYPGRRMERFAAYAAAIYYCVGLGFLG